MILIQKQLDKLTDKTVITQEEIIKILRKGMKLRENGFKHIL